MSCGEFHFPDCDCDSCQLIAAKAEVISLRERLETSGACVSYAPAVQLVGQNGEVELCTCMLCGSVIETCQQELHGEWHMGAADQKSGGARTTYMVGG